MGNKLFVGGLAWATTDQSLRAAFEAHGEVKDARVITDRETGRSRGFGFVTMGDDESAKKAMEAMDGAEIDGRNVRVNEAQERSRGPGGGGPRPPRSGGPPRHSGPPRDRGYPPVERRGGGGGGGYGGGGGGGYRSGGGGGGGGSGGPPPPIDSKPAGRKRHNGGGKRKRGRDDRDEYVDDGRGGGGRRKRRGGGNRREFDGDY